MKFFAITATLLTLVPFAAHAATKQVRAKAPQSVQELLPCGSVNTPVGLLVNFETPGYRQVEVTLDTDVPRTPTGELVNGIAFAFALDTNERIHRDSLGAMKWLSRCDHDVIRDGKLYKAGSVWMKIRTAIAESDLWPDEKGITIHAFVWLPDSVVTQEPAAYTMLKDGVSYTGTWQKGEKGSVKLVLKPD